MLPSALPFLTWRLFGSEVFSGFIFWEKRPPGVPFGSPLLHLCCDVLSLVEALQS